MITVNREWSALILTGGKSSRFGSDKSQAMIGRNSLLNQLLVTLPENIEVVVVGPHSNDAPRHVSYVRESPIGGGPVAAIDEGLKSINSEFVAIIATDMPFASKIVMELMKYSVTLEDGAVPLDSQGVRQTLCAIYRVKPLQKAIANLGNPQGQSMRSLISKLDIREIKVGQVLEGKLLDIDTPADLARALILSQESELDPKLESVKSMKEWIEAVQKELGINVNLDHELILDVARDAAHVIERKAAPVTTFLLGFAVAAGADAKEVTKKIAELAKNWPADK